MSHTLTVSDALYAHLQREAARRGLQDIESLLEECHGESAKRREAVRRVDALRERLHARYGVQPDSVELLREDRNR